MSDPTQSIESSQGLLVYQLHSSSHLSAPSGPSGQVIAFSVPGTHTPPPVQVPHEPVVHVPVDVLHDTVLV